MSESHLSRLDRFRSKLPQAIALDFPHPFRPILSGRPAAVLILGGVREADGEFEILLTRRTEHLETHKGQYALPGGMQDLGDDSLEGTALRETEEEMGISRSNIEVFGKLPEIWTPSGFTVTPVVGLLTEPIETQRMVPNPEEIDLWFWCKLARFREEGVYSTELRTIMRDSKPLSVPVDIYQIGEHRIWGATGAMLRNFIARLEKTGIVG